MAISTSAWETEARQMIPGNRAQTPSILLGKLLRIDVNIPVGSPDAYLIPPTNPFTGAGTARCPTGGALTGPTCQELWTLGMRNPWRYSFDRSNGALWVADVGQGSGRRSRCDH
jgi:glucose/arabinose dehydrogenase